MSEREYDVPAVRKAFSLIELLCESPKPLGITEISQQLDINKNMVFRLVRTMTELGWIVADSEDSLKYRMTLLPFQHTSKPVSRMSVRLAALEPLRHLWEATQLSCYLCILEQRRALCIEHLDATGLLRVHGRVGGHYHLNATAPGKILLAYDQGDLLEELSRSDLPQLTTNTLTQKSRLRAHLAEVVQQGFAIDNRENAEGVVCYAVPVMNYEGKVVAALGLSALTIEYSIERMVDELGPLVDQAGKAASLIMGFHENNGISRQNSAHLN